MVNWLTTNWSLKLTSLILAVGLWYYAIGEEGIEVTRMIPLDLKVENTQMSILKSSASSLKVTFMAPRALVSDLASKEIRAEHLIPNNVNKAGDYSFRLETGEIKVKNPQIRILKIEPDTVQITLDEIMVKKTEIQPDFSGEPAFGYKVRLNDLELNPNAVLLEGPKGSLEKLEFVKTQPVNLVGRTRSFRQTITLNVPPGFKLIGEPLIDMYVPIDQESDEKEFSDIVIKIISSANKNQSIELVPPKVSLTFKGSKKQLESMAPENVFVYVNTQDLEKGEYDLPISYFLPEGVVIKGDPVKVRVKVR